MTARRLRRRDLLLGLGRAVMSFLGLAAVAAAAPGCARARDPLSKALSRFFDEPESAAEVGAAYLAHVPEEADRQMLLARLFATGVADARELAASDPTALIERLREQHHEDFASGHITRVAGWTLSLTEARLCAWAALDAG